MSLPTTAARAATASRSGPRAVRPRPTRSSTACSPSLGCRSKSPLGRCATVARRGQRALRLGRAGRRRRLGACATTTAPASAALPGRHRSPRDRPLAGVSHEPETLGAPVDRPRHARCATSERVRPSDTCAELPRDTASYGAPSGTRIRRTHLLFPSAGAWGQPRSSRWSRSHACAGQWRRDRVRVCPFPGGARLVRDHGRGKGGPIAEPHATVPALPAPTDEGSSECSQASGGIACSADRWKSSRAGSTRASPRTSAAGRDSWRTSSWTAATARSSR